MLEAPGVALTVIAFLLVLGPLVFVHEYGHYIVGRWCGVKADTFSIGFGRKIIRWRDKRGTDWQIGWLPLGGYVQFAGDRDAASRPDGAWQQLPQAERDHSFPAAALWKRAAIVAAGPITNFLFALLILTGFAWLSGTPTTPPVVGKLMEGGPAAAAGLVEGDRILSVDGREMQYFTDIPMAVAHRANEPVSLRVLSPDGAERSVTVTPALRKSKDPFGNDMETGILGVQAGKIVFEKVPLSEAPVIAIRQTKQIIQQTFDVLGQLLTGNRSVKDMSGPLKIAKASGEAASMGAASLIFLAALISINLGFINLLPLPMLDGGHLLFYGYEAIVRRPVPPQAQEWAFRFGFMAIVTLMVVVTFNDLGSFGLWNQIARLIG